MRKTREVLRLRFELGLSQDQIARSCSISQAAVSNYLKRAQATGVTWPLPEGWDETRLEEALFRHSPRRVWRRQLDVVLRHEHKAGEKLFVDYAGDTLPVYDPQGGPVRQASLFVAVLGASTYTYAEATGSQDLEDWLGAHVRTLEFLGGVPQLIVPDNARTGVRRACRYEPDLNPAYQEWAMHYGVGVLPTRPYKPRAKA